MRLARYARFLLGGLIAAALTLRASAAPMVMDARPLILEHLTTADGLPQGTVMTTLQDSQGFVWLGTEDGLVRFDGHELVRYAYSRSNRSGLPGNFIYRVVEDKKHDLWIAMKDAGVARWNRATDSFTVYRHEASHASSLSSDSARDLLVSQGKIWVATSNTGINVLDPVSGSVEHLQHDDADPTSLPDNSVFSLSLDRSGRVWAGTGKGLALWDDARHAFIRYPHVSADGHAPGGHQVSQILEDRSGEMWIGTFDGGLARMDRYGRISRVFRHHPNEPGSLASDDIRAILEDQAGHLWIGTPEGLDLLDRSTGQITHYRQDLSDAESLRDSFIMSLYEDDSGLVWIGTRSGGASRWNPRSWELGGHRPQWLGGKLVTSFADAGDQKVWIGSLGGGLTLFDPETGDAANFETLLGKSDVLGDKRVMSLRRDRRGNLWIGTMVNGLLMLSPDGRLQSIPVKLGDSHSLSSAGIQSIFESRSGTLWIGTHGGGANLLDPVTHQVRQLPHDTSQPGAVSFANVSAFAEDSRGNVWIGTDGGGLDLARSDGTVVKVFRHDADDPGTLPANTVYSLAVDDQDRVWVGTDGGGLALVLGNPAAPESIRFKALSREEGLSSDTVYGIVADLKGRIWLSGNAGLLRYDPEAHVVKTYHRQHGLQGEEFDSGAYYRLPDGRVCFGGPGGFNIFDPARITENRRPPRLALTQVAVMGVPISTSRPTWLLDRLSLNFRANIVSLDFGALDFTSPKRNRIAYRMAGLTDRWIDVGSQHRITLTNLEAGDHVLEVRAANADSVWSRDSLRLTVHRDPAPWRSLWAYTAYVLAALAFAAYRINLQRRKFQRVVREQQRLESEVALRTRELRDSNSQLAEAVQAKGRFLDRMSHELRTPMNGVLGMTELLARTNLSAAQSRIIQTIRSSGQVLLQIVNDLLDLSKINAGKVVLEELPVDLLLILEDCANLFAGAVAGKGLELIVCPPRQDHLNLVGDPLRLRQIVMNLIGNAVKFTSQGEIVIRADVEAGTSGHSTLKLSVCDTGIGMDAATMAKIFSPFTQADESTTRRFGGTGLGLAICRELTQVMGGSIRVESEPQAGATFHVSVPLKNATPALGTDRQPLPARRCRVITRRRALAESLGRHLSALGMTVVPDGDDAPAAIVLVEAECVQHYQKALHGRQWSNTSLIIVATEADVESESFGPVASEYTIAPKPTRRDTLHNALCIATGLKISAADTVSVGAITAGNLGAHVLLVEDEPVNAAVAEGYLDALGCTSIWVKSGEEAVARNASETFDLILMDLSMPTLDGFATTALIRSHESAGRRVPIVALTAHSSIDYRQKVLQAGMDDILSKPCTLEECEALVRRWLPPARDREPEPAAPAKEEVNLTQIDTVAVARLRKLRGSAQPDLYPKLVDLFASGSADCMQQLQVAYQMQDPAAAASICHKFASSAANVGASAFAQAVRELERLSAAGETRRCKDLYEQLCAAYPALLKELQCHRLPASA